MHTKDLRDLFVLAAIWGSSFLFMLVSVHDFGPIALIEVRVGVSALFLLGLAIAMGKTQDLRRHWKPIAVCGILNAAIPFTFFAYAAQSLTASSLSIINAMAPLFGAIIARVWLHERLSWTRVLGLALGFAGILVLVSDDWSFGEGGQGWAVLAAIGAPFFYGIAASYTAKYLRGVEPMACAAGTMLAAALVLLPLAIWTWPSTPISTVAWLSALALAIFCTALAYLIFYRLIDRVGATRTITVTFLVPPFGVLWGVVLLGEPLTATLLLGGSIVMVGTLLATGFIGKKTAAP
jgi:drug/metabolite transporter (DMT)-like permease